MTTLTTEGHVKPAAPVRRIERRTHLGTTERSTTAPTTTGTTFGADGRSRRSSASRRDDGTPIGPFDPQRPDDTLLSDGKVDAGDAPMPAARVDIDDRPEQRRARPTSPASAPSARLQAASLQPRPHSARRPTHNIYAPFNSQYIPATRGLPIAVAPSGIDGAGRQQLQRLPRSTGSTPTGTSPPRYQALGGNTNCLLRRNSTPLLDRCSGTRFRQLPVRRPARRRLHR